RAIEQQLAGHPGTDALDPAVFHALAQSASDLAERVLLRLLPARLLGEADEHVLRAPELLQLDVAEAQAAERRAHFREIGGAGFLLDLDQGPAAEIDAEIQSRMEIQQDGDDRQNFPRREVP